MKSRSRPSVTVQAQRVWWGQFICTAIIAVEKCTILQRLMYSVSKHRSRSPGNSACLFSMPRTISMKSLTLTATIALLMDRQKDKMMDGWMDILDGLNNGSDLNSYVTSCYKQVWQQKIPSISWGKQLKHFLNEIISSKKFITKHLAWLILHKYMQ